MELNYEEDIQCTFFTAIVCIMYTCSINNTTATLTAKGGFFCTAVH